MPRASALAPQAVSGVRSFIKRVHKVDNSTARDDDVSNSSVFLEFLIFL
jgi:hypothetical protein